MTDITQIANNDGGLEIRENLNELINRANDGGKFYGSVIPTDTAPSTLKEGATVQPSIDGIYLNHGGLERKNEICVFVYESSAWVKKTILNKPILSETQLSKNLFNSADVLDGFFISTTTGALIANVDAAVSDLIPINEKSNYYLSGRNLGVAYNVAFYDENESILPTIWLTYQPPTEDISFLTPENAAFVRFTVKISGVGTYDAIQLEVGQTQTAYDSFDETEEKIPVSYLPDVSKDIMTVLVENDFLYIRTKFDNTRDLIQKVGVYFLDDKNNVINFQDTKLIDGGEVNDIAIFEAGELIHNCPDDAAPNNYNGSFIGGNHGCSDMRVVTSTGHGKTNEDVGSEWLDVSLNKFYIVKIVDVDTLWMLSENIGTAEIWDFITTINGDLTHSSGATNTGTIIVGGVVGGQMFPSIKNQKKKIILDGTLIKTNGVYSGEKLDLVEEYDIVNPSSVLNYLIGSVGNSNPLPLNNADAQVLNQLTYRFLPNSSCTILNGWLTKQEIDLFYTGFTQMAVLSAAINPKIKMYMPKSLPISDGTTTFDFRNIDTLTAPLTALNFDPTKWETPLSPINRAIEYSATSGDELKIGFAHGVDSTKGVGIDANRVDLVTHAWSISTGRKSYPRAFDFTLVNVPPNTWYNGVAFRHYFNPELLENANGFTYYEVGSNVVVNVDYQSFTGIESIELPSKYLGMNATVIESSSNMNLLSDFVIENGLAIQKTTSSYGYITIILE